VAANATITRTIDPVRETGALTVCMRFVFIAGIGIVEFTVPARRAIAPRARVPFHIASVACGSTWEKSRDRTREGSRDRTREGNRDRTREGNRDRTREGSRDRTRERCRERGLERSQGHSSRAKKSLSTRASKACVMESQKKDGREDGKLDILHRNRQMVYG
jgi:hypothetical protein